MSDDLFRNPGLIDPPLMEKNESIAKFGSDVQIMGGHDDGEAPLPIKAKDEIQEFDLVMDV